MLFNSVLNITPSYTKNVDIGKIFGFTNCRAIIEQLLNNSTKIGMININRSNDGIIRTVPTFAKYKNKYYPYLTVMVGNDYINQNTEHEYIIDNKSNLKSGKLNIPVTNSGECVLNWYGPAQKTYKNIPFYKLIQATQGEKIAEQYDFKDKIIFVGTER